VIRRATFLVGLFGLACLAPGTALAANAPASSPYPSREVIRSALSDLSDAEVGALVRGRIGTVPTDRGRDLASAASALDDFRARFNDLVAAAGNLPGDPAIVAAKLREGDPGRPARMLGLLVVMAAVGCALELLGLWALRDVSRRLRESLVAGPLAAALRTLLLIVLGLLRVALFGLGALAVFLARYPIHVPTRHALLAALGAVVLVRLAAVGARVVLSPTNRKLRLVPFDDRAAWRLYAALMGLATLAVVGTLGARLLALLDVPEPDVVVFLTLVRIVFAAILLVVIWTMRHEMAAAIEMEDDHQRFWGVVRDLGPYLATVYVLAILLFGVVEIVHAGGLTPGAVLGSLLLVVAAPLLDMALCHILTPRSSRSGDPSQPGTPSTGSYGSVVRRVVHILVAVGSLETLAWLWELDIAALTERSLGGRLARAVVDIAVTALAAYLAWTLVRTFIDHRLAQEPGRAGQPEPGEEGGTGTTRLRTLLPLLRTFIQIVIAVMAVMIGLAGLGVNIGPLLAGAGIAGIAIGFGTQTLVRDIVSGVFFLVDDSFRLGEYVDVGPVKGTVERISLRSMQIRHHRGALHTIPFGEVKRLTNHSREWVIHKVELPLPPETDLDVIRKMLKRIGEELAADPQLGPHIIQPLKSQGLMQVDDGALILRAKFMVRPDDQQFVIRREVLSRIKAGLQERGIRFAPRQVLVHVAQPSPAPDAPARVPAGGTPGPAAAAAGAAAAALVTGPPSSDSAGVPAKRES
jgi:small-conductance mechanosensitive channel